MLEHTLNIPEIIWHLVQSRESINGKFIGFQKFPPWCHLFIASLNQMGWGRQCIIWMELLPENQTRFQSQREFSIKSWTTWSVFTASLHLTKLDSYMLYMENNRREMKCQKLSSRIYWIWNRVGFWGLAILIDLNDTVCFV